MIDLDLIQYRTALRTAERDGGRVIFDPVRKEWVKLQPEELVRQILIRYLNDAQGINFNRMAVEVKLTVGKKQEKRWDLLLYDPEVQPWMIVECKAPRETFDDQAFREGNLLKSPIWQIRKYNMTLQAPYYLITNGQTTYCYRTNAQANKMEALDYFPSYPSPKNPG